MNVFAGLCPPGSYVDLCMLLGVLYELKSPEEERIKQSFLVQACRLSWSDGVFTEEDNIGHYSMLRKKVISNRAISVGHRLYMGLHLFGNHL